MSTSIILGIGQFAESGRAVVIKFRKFRQTVRWRTGSSGGLLEKVMWNGIQGLSWGAEDAEGLDSGGGCEKQSRQQIQLFDRMDMKTLLLLLEGVQVC